MGLLLGGGGITHASLAHVRQLAIALASDGVARRMARTHSLASGDRFALAVLRLRCCALAGGSHGFTAHGLSANIGHVVLTTRCMWGEGRSVDLVLDARQGGCDYGAIG